MIRGLWLTLTCFVLVLNKLVSKLDNRASKLETTKHGYKKKVRVLKSPSKLDPPVSAPKWAVKSTIRQTETPPSSRTNTPSTGHSCSHRRLNLHVTELDLSSESEDEFSDGNSYVSSSDLD